MEIGIDTTCKRVASNLQEQKNYDKVKEIGLQNTFPPPQLKPVSNIIGGLLHNINI